MKATICDFCGATTPVSDAPKTMLYDISIFSAADYKAETADEKSLLLEAEDVCAECTKRVREMIVKVKAICAADMKREKA